MLTGCSRQIEKVRLTLTFSCVKRRMNIDILS